MARSPVAQTRVTDDIKFYCMRDQGESRKFTFYFTKMICSIFKAPKKISFITTDSPVQLYNHLTHNTNEARIYLSETRVIFPLSSRYLLEMRHEESDFITHMNHNIVIPTNSPTDGRICIEQAYRLRDCTAEKVMQTNCILIQLADRFVVASSKKIFEDLQEVYFPK